MMSYYDGFEEREGRKLIIFVFSVLILSIGYFGYMAINLKSKTFGGFVFGCVTLLTVIYLATSKDVINKVGSNAASVEPRLEKVEKATMRQDTIQTKIVTDQKELRQVVDKVLKHFEFEKKRGNLMILPGENEAKDFDRFTDSMNENEKQLRKITK